MQQQYLFFPQLNANGRNEIKGLKINHELTQIKNKHCPIYNERYNINSHTKNTNPELFSESYQEQLLY